MPFRPRTIVLAGIRCWCWGSLLVLIVVLLCCTCILRGVLGGCLVDFVLCVAGWLGGALAFYQAARSQGCSIKVVVAGTFGAADTY